MTVEDENRLQCKVNELITKNEDNNYLIEIKLRKENELELIRQRDSENTYAIILLSDKLSSVIDEIAKLKTRY